MLCNVNILFKSCDTKVATLYFHNEKQHRDKVSTLPLERERHKATESMSMHIYGAPLMNLSKRSQVHAQSIRVAVFGLPYVRSSINIQK